MPRELKPCGTMAAARRHWRNKEELCNACREADRQYQRDRHGWQPFRAAECGTVAGYRRHLRKDGKACAECKAANVEAARKYKARRGGHS